MPRPQTPFTDPALPQTAQDRLNTMYREHTFLMLTQGFADYTDTQYTSAEPFSFSSDTPTAIPNNATLGEQQYLRVPPMWDASEGKFVLQLHDAFFVTMEMTLRPTQGGRAFVDIWWDPQDGIPDRYRLHMALDRGQNESHRITHSFFGYACPSCANNGAIPTISATRNMEVYDIRWIVGLLFREDTAL